MKKELTDITKNSGLVFIGKIFGVVFGFLLNFIAARFMGAEIYGRFMYVYTLVLFLSVVMKLGLNQGLISFIPRIMENGEINKRNNLISFSFVLVLSLSILLSIILMIKSKFIAKLILNDEGLASVVKLLSPLIIFLTFIKLAKGVFRGIEKIKYFVQSQNIIISVSRLLLVLLFAFLGYKLYGLVLTYYISFIFGCIYLIKIMNGFNFLTVPSFDFRKDYKRIISFSFPLLLSGVLIFFVNKLDTFMIGYFLSENDVGIYNIALKIGILSNFALTSFNTMFAPVISSLYYKNEMEKLSKMYKVITKWILATNLVMFSLGLLFSKEIMHIFGRGFIVGSDALILILIGRVISASVGSAGYINIMTNNPQYDLYTNIIALLINFILNYNLIPIYGIEGAAFASLVALGVTNIIRVLLVYKEHRIHPYNKSYMKLFISIIITFLIVFTLNMFISYLWIIQLLLFSFIFVMIFGFIYYHLGLSVEDTIILDAILDKINFK